MKKYKLLKDLPRAKAGTIVCITNAHSNSPWIVKINKWSEDEQQRPRLAFIHTRNVDEWLEEIPELKSIWDLKKWDSYWFISNTDIFGDIITDYEEFKVNYLNIGNAFSTQEEARKELNKRKALQRIRKYCHENGIINKEFKWYEHNYLICYDDLDKKFYIEYYEVSYFINDLWYFKTYEDCKKIIDNCEAGLKIIFNV